MSDNNVLDFSQILNQHIVNPIKKKFLDVEHILSTLTEQYKDLLHNDEEQVKEIKLLTAKLNHLVSEVTMLEKSLKEEKVFQTNLIDAIKTLNWS